jgi:NO-binding membrane sensor protein with MHYT domain/nitrogen-specific signal transduction histidine kinase
MTGSYDPLQVALSLLIAIAASYAALDLAGRVTAARDWVRAAWLSGGAVAMGIGIWAMHFVGMLAFSLPVPIAYRWPTVLASLLVSVLASGFALFVVSRHKLGPLRASIGAIIMGVGIAAMHYIAMDAMCMAAKSRFGIILVGLSVALAIGFSLLALLLAFDLRETVRGASTRQVVGALAMGVAISTMHYTGMASARFMPIAVSPDLTDTINVSSLGTLGIGTVTLMILGLAMVSSSVDRRFDAQALELALREARMELARVVRIGTLSDLMASIAHEVNQPLAAVVTNGGAALRWLAANPPELAEAREAMTRVVTEANRASDVINRLRALVAKAPLEFRPLNINEIIREAMALTHAEASGRGVTMTSDMAVDLPDVLGDSIQLQQVVLNLIMNGIEAMDTVAGRPRELLVRSVGDPHGVRVEVRDAGEGFTPEQAARLFEPFYTTKPKGIGMGLAISRTIVEAHGGRLWAAPGPSHGSVFQFTLPRTDRSQGEPPTVSFGLSKGPAEALSR